MAAVDTVHGGQYVDDEAELAEQIAAAAAYSYAAPPHSAVATKLARMLAALLHSLAPSVREAISGPFWIIGTAFDSLVPDAAGKIEGVSGQAFALVVSDGRLLVQLEK